MKLQFKDGKLTQEADKEIYDPKKILNQLTALGATNIKLSRENKVISIETDKELAPTELILLEETLKRIDLNKQKFSENADDNP
jgi:hypothetical protein